MAKRPVLDIDILAFLKATALLVLLCIWLGLGWGGIAQTAALLLYLAITAAEVSLAALATALFFVFLTSFSVGFTLPQEVQPNTITLLVAGAVSIMKGRRLLATGDGRIAPLLVSPRWNPRLKRLVALIALVSFAATVFKSVDPASALAFGALFLLAWMRLHPLTPPTVHTGKQSDSWATKALLAGALVLSLLILEFGARLVLPPVSNSTDTYVNDVDYVFLLRPNGHGENIVPLEGGGTKKVPLRISNQGLREEEIPAKAPGEFRIALLGDSFTMGHAAMEDETISHLLETRLTQTMPGTRIRVINCGIGGGGPIQELGMLRKRALPLQPDLVILQLFLGNDLDNALEKVGKRQRSFNVEWQQQLTEYCRLNLVQVRAERWMGRNLRAYLALRSSTGRRWMFEFVESLRGVKPAGQTGKPREERPDTLESDLEEWYPELEEGFAILKEHVLRMRGECAERGVDFMAYCIPEMNQIDDALWAKASSHAKNQKYERLKGIRLTEQFLTQASIPFVSMVAPLRAAGTVSDAYYILDGHTSPLGNRVIADVWADWLTKDYLHARLAREPKK